MIQLQRRALRMEGDGERRAVQPKGGVLLRIDPRQAADTEPPLGIEEEEVPREGAVVIRAFQFARWLSPRAGMKKGTAARATTIPKSCSLFNQVVARGVMTVLDGSSVCCSCRSCV